jgi:hypothetical protein
MILKDESLILDIDTRVALIEQIESNKNITRKVEAKKRYEIYKDKIKRYILENLHRELEDETVRDMESRISTLNIYKKVINKKARVYKTTPKRIAKDESHQEILDQYVDAIKLNLNMKKTNRLLEALCNTDVYVRPIEDNKEVTVDGKSKWSYRLDPLPTHNYDVIEDARDRERAIGYILSDFCGSVIQDTVGSNVSRDDGQAAIVATNEGCHEETAEEKKNKEYVFWGNTYHFTFRSDGTIVKEKSPDDLLNPIECMPFGSFAKDKDGKFWADGGEDLVEGSILINTILTDVYYIAKMHGTGLFYLFGKGVPKNLKVGPNQGITLEVEEGDPTPSIGFANASPQLNDHKDLIEQYLAILLTTNDLEPNSVSGTLSVGGASSGVQELIIKSEPVGAIEDDQEIFKDEEPNVTKIASKWHNLYLDKGLLVEKLEELGPIPDDLDYTIKFGAVQQFFSEKEKLEVIEKRLQLEIDDMVDAMILDNPDLSREDAEKILLERSKKKLEAHKEALGNMISDGTEEDEDIEENEPKDESQVD